MLQELFVKQPGYLEFVESIDLQLNRDHSEDDSASADELQLTEYLQKAVDSGCEGLMIKTLDDDSEYKAGVRSFSWMKVKHDYLTDNSSSASSKSASSTSNGVFLPDTLDLVPIGAFYGKGRRAGVLGSFLMATYDSDSGCYEVCPWIIGFICFVRTHFASNSTVDNHKSGHRVLRCYAGGTYATAFASTDPSR